MKAHELLRDASKWAKRATALDADGYRCSATDPKAARWCIAGAVLRCYAADEQDTVWKKLEAEVVNIPRFNDFHSHQEVIDLLRKLDV